VVQWLGTGVIMPGPRPATPAADTGRTGWGACWPRVLAGLAAVGRCNDAVPIADGAGFAGLPALIAVRVEVIDAIRF
jgi:hypothetical protein